MKKSILDNNYVAHELQKMAENIKVQIKDCMFFEGYQMFVIAFFKSFKSVYSACRAHKGAEMQLFKQYTIGSDGAAINH